MTPEDLKKWREEHFYSQQQLADALGVTNICVSRWEIGMRNIPSFLALALRALELEGGEQKIKGMKTKKGRKVKK